MDELEFTEMRRTLSGFDGVWKRVSGQSPVPEAPGGGPEMTLRSFIGDERALARALICLARMPRNSLNRNALLRLAGHSKNRAARLRAEVFVRSGDIVDPAPGGQGPKIYLDGLREAMKAAEDLSRDYQKAAQDIRDEALSQTLRRFSSETAEAARTLKDMILACFV